VRISDDRTGENASIARQRKLIRELAVRLDIDRARFAGSRTRPARPVMGLVRGSWSCWPAVRNGEVSMVFVWVPDRLWRNDDDQREITKVFRAASLKVFSAQGADLDFTTAQGRFINKIVGSASAFEVEQRGERVALAAEYRARKGRFGGGVRRFGFQQRDTRIVHTMDDEGHTTEEIRPHGPLVLVPEEAAAIADGYRMVAGGASLNAVTRDWRARGLVGVQGGPITPMVVRGILVRPANAGLSSYKGTIVGTGDWPAITDPDTYATVKAILEDPSRRTNVGRPAAHLLSGVLVCAACGGKMLASSKARGQTYRCRAGRELPENKVGIHVQRRRAKLETAITELVLAHIVNNARKLDRPGKTPRSPSVAKAVQEAAKLRGKIESYQLQADQFEPADLAGLLRSLRAKLAAEERKVVKAAGRPATHALVASGDIPAAWAALDTAGKRTVIMENVEKIVVGPGLVGSKTATMHNVEVFWRED
jgi:site-specific DNA recombinase